MPTGHWNSQAPQVVHWKTASWELYLPRSGSSAARPDVVEVGADAEDDFLGVEKLAGVGGGAVLGAAAAFDAGVGLQADELGKILTGDETEVFIIGQRRDGAEAAAGQKYSRRAQHQVQVLGVRNQWQEDQQRQGVRPPENAGRDSSVGCEERCQVGCHQEEDQPGDYARFVGGLLTEPTRAYEKATNKQAQNADSAGDGESRGEVEVEASDEARRGKKTDTEPDRCMIQGDQGECQKSPEDEGVGQAGKWPLLNHLGLAEDLGEEVPGAAAHVSQVKARVFFGLEDLVENGAKTAPEEQAGNDRQGGEDEFLHEGEVLRLCQSQRERNHRQTTPTIHDQG